MVSNDLIKRLAEEPNNPEVTLALALEYDALGQNAPAISLYLKTAEYGYSTHKLHAYTALLLASKAFQKQTGRDHSVLNAIYQAASYMPERPEAWYYLAIHEETAQQWQKCYTYTVLAEQCLDKVKDTLPVDLGIYKHVVQYEKAAAAWWIGRKDESTSIFNTLLTSNLSEEFKQSVRWNMERVGLTMSEITPVDNKAPYDRFMENGFYNVYGWVKTTLPPFLASIKDIPWNGTGGVCEIGAYKGRFFLTLRSLLPQAEDSYAIDVFDSQDFNIDLSGEADATVEALANNVNAYDPFGGAKVNIMKLDSTTATGHDEIYKTIPAGSMKYVSIDGGHTMAHVMNDLKLAEHVLSDGGIVIMDDILHPHWLGVISGVTEYLRARPTLVPFAIGYNKLFLCRMSYYPKYIEELKTNPYSQQLVTFMDKPLWGVEKIDWLI